MLKILLVEDSPSDREILKHLLEAKFKGKVEFNEVSTLESAFDFLENKKTDCVVLDLHLPDSAGIETFLKLNRRFPDVPFVVMTHSRDQNLAMKMIEEGAADFVVKSYGDEEEIFRRISFAVEKHRNSVRVATPDAARSYNKLQRANVNLQEAQAREENPSKIRDIQVEVTSAVADLSRRMFTQLQDINLKLTELSTKQEATSQTVKTLDKELLRGHSSRPSMRSQMDLLEHRIEILEEDVKDVETTVKDVEGTQRQDLIQITTAKVSNRTKVVIGFFTLLGVVTTAVGTYFATNAQSKTPAPKIIEAP